MLGVKEVPTSVQAQYLTAMKYSGKPRVEVLVNVDIGLVEKPFQHAGL